MAFFSWRRRVLRSRQRETARRRSFQPRIEVLEQRWVMDYRSITGTGNNTAHTAWGAASTDLLRNSPVRYANGISTPSLPNNPGAHALSNHLNDQTDTSTGPPYTTELNPPQSQHLSDFAYVWGQFLDHDLDLTTGTSGQAFNIPPDPNPPIDVGSPDPMGTEPFTRSTFDPNTGTSTSNPRQQVNSNTSFEDLSQVYGSSQVVADGLRTFSGGHLKTSTGNLLPFDNTSYFTSAQITAMNLANDAMQVPTGSLYAAGDVRANENVELTAMQTLFVRNHNRIADILHQENPNWSEETLYQQARKLNIAIAESITNNDFIPAILGPNAVPRYTGYKSNVNPGIATEISTVGFRFGHSLLSGNVGRDLNNGTAVPDAPGYPNSGGTVDLTADFFDPYLITPNGAIDPLTGKVSTSIGDILKADADNQANEFDRYLIHQIRNELFGDPHAPGTDLAARDIQRARDHGIGTYNDVRVAYHLSPVTSYAQITSDPDNQAALAAAYGPNGVNNVDPFEGILFEDHVPGANVGPTTRAILADQFTRLRDGDRFYYLNENFSSAQQAIIDGSNTLAKVIKNNTEITNLQSNVFFLHLEISGHVFADPDGNGVHGDTERNLSGVSVDLIDDNGNVVATAVTDGTGKYDFTDITGIPGTGNFTVALDPAGLASTGLDQTAAQIASNPGTISLSRGDLNITNRDFGVISTRVNFLTGFAGVAGLQINGSAQVSGSNLRLTDGGYNEAGSVFTTSQVSIAQFSTFFTFQLTNADADGITFTIQRQDPTALGSSGGGLGYATDGSSSGSVIHNSAAIKFDLHDNQGEGDDSTGLYFNGAPPTVPSVDLSYTGIDLHSGDQFEGRIDYNGSNLLLRIDDNYTGYTVEVLFRNVNIPAAIGGSTAYVGFTGGTGSLTAIQDIQNWDFMPMTSNGTPTLPEGGGGNGDPVVVYFHSPGQEGRARGAGLAARSPILAGSPSGADANLVNILVSQSHYPAGNGIVARDSSGTPAPEQRPNPDPTLATSPQLGSSADLTANGPAASASDAVWTVLGDAPSNSGSQDPFADRL